MNSKKLFTTKNMAVIAILSSMAVVLMAFDFPLPIAPAFYKIDFSEVPVLIGAFALGPIAAICIEGIKIIIDTALFGSSTAYVGEIANFIIGISFAVPAAIIYKQHKDKKGALISLLIGTLFMTFVGLVLNYFVLLPAYSYFYHMDMDTIIKMGSAIFPIIKDKLTFVLFATTPFNLVKGFVVSLIVRLVYKHISSIIKKFH